MMQRQQAPEFIFIKRFFQEAHEDEDGMVTWAFLVAILFFTIFAGFVYNAGNTINRKIETQNAADAAAYSGSVWIARGMNALTASNHLIGELNAMYVIHHSLGGRWLDEKQRSQKNSKGLSAANTWIDSAYALAKSSKPVPTVAKMKTKVRENPSADVNSTIYDAKKQLKLIMAGAYTTHAVGYGMYLAGKASTAAFGAGLALIAAGTALEAAALVTESLVYKEYLILEGVEILAHTLKGPKKLLPKGMSALNKIYQRGALVAIPRLAVNSASSIAARHGAVGAIHGDLPSGKRPKDLAGLVKELGQFFPNLPVEKEETTNEQRSQLIRATYPWVLHWRSKVNSFFDDVALGAPMSGAAGHFTGWTNVYTLQSSTWLRRETKKSNYKDKLTLVNGTTGAGEKGLGLRLYVLKGLNKTKEGIAKGDESWNNWKQPRTASSEIERTFCHVAFARSEPPTIMPRRFFRQENPNGIVCFAQSMIYNANPQAQSNQGNTQIDSGWDTLNFTARAFEYPQSGESSQAPEVRCNWQARLTIATPEKLLRVMVKAAAQDSRVANVMANSREGIVLSNQ